VSSIALVGDPADLANAYMGWLAGQRGIGVVTLDESRLGDDWSYKSDERCNGVTLTVGERAMSLSDITGAFVRLNPRPDMPPGLELSPIEEVVYLRERRNGLVAFLNAAPWILVNRPYAGRSNGSKPMHMAQLARSGFAMPKWIVVSDRNRAAEFIARSPNGCIYKSCSGLRSHVRIADEALLERLDRPTTPLILQHYVPGHDVRVHTVGETCIASRVDSSAVDYRFDAAGTAYSAVTPPPEISQSCILFAKLSGLVLAGFDFRVDSRSRWWCLEANPVPTFLPYEAGTGQPIGDRVLDSMAPSSARPVTRSRLATSGITPT
jgi:hypothetical protein